MSTPATPCPGEPAPPVHSAPPGPHRQRRAGLLAGIIGAVALALLVGTAGVVWLDGPSSGTARFAADPLKPTEPDLYSDTPRCDAFSDEITEEIVAEFEDEPLRDDHAPGNAEEGSGCSWLKPGLPPVFLKVTVTRYGTGHGVSGGARAQALLPRGGDSVNRMEGQWDFAVLDHEDCAVGARDSNVLLWVSVRAVADDSPCDEERLLRYARDWAEQNFTR